MNTERRRLKLIGGERGITKAKPNRIDYTLASKTRATNRITNAKSKRINDTFVPKSV